MLPGPPLAQPANATLRRQPHTAGAATQVVAAERAVAAKVAAEKAAAEQAAAEQATAAAAKKAAAEKAAAKEAAAKEAVDRAVAARQATVAAIPEGPRTTPLSYSKWDNFNSDTDSSRSPSPVLRRDEEARVAPKSEPVTKKKAKKKKKKKSALYGVTDSSTMDDALRSAMHEGDPAGLQRALDQWSNDGRIGEWWPFNLGSMQSHLPSIYPPHPCTALADDQLLSEMVTLASGPRTMQLLPVLARYDAPLTADTFDFMLGALRNGAATRSSVRCSRHAAGIRRR